MKKNYWIDEKVHKQKIFPGLTAVQAEFRILSENEFKCKISSKIKDGLTGILISAATIGAGYFTDKYLIPEQNKNDFNNLIYVIGAASATSGGKKTFEYFRHRNDKKPNSTEDAVKDIIYRAK